VTLLPFSTRLLYWSNILLLGVVLYASWFYAVAPVC
jgi:hypothetical protein